MIRRIILPFLLSLLAACGGGSSGDQASAPPPIQTAPPPVASNPPPVPSGIDPAPTEVRAKIVAAAAASDTSASSVAWPLPLTAGASVFINEIQHFVTLHKTADGRFFGISNRAGTHLIDPMTVKSICYNSPETGWNVDGRTSRACAPVDPVTGYSELPRYATCNRARGTWSVVLKGALKPGRDGSHWQDWEDGESLWSDHESERRWNLDGLPAVRHTGEGNPLRGLVDYGTGGRHQPTISETIVGGKIDVTLDFGSNCLGGFGLGGRPTDFMPAPNTWFKFLYNSDEQGYGLERVGDTMPSTLEGVLTYDLVTGSYKLVFRGIKCATRGQITVYRGVGLTPETAVWEPGINQTTKVAEGAGWFGIQADPNELQLWEPLPAVVFDRNLYVFVLPACPA